MAHGGSDFVGDLESFVDHFLRFFTVAERT